MTGPTRPPCLQEIAMAAHEIEYPGVNDDPFNTICCLSIIYANGSNDGTGFIVGPRTIITAGHCVLDPERGPAKKITVMRARYGSYNLSQCVTRSFDFPQEWEDALRQNPPPKLPPPEHDYGAIFLPNDALYSIRPNK